MSLDSIPIWAIFLGTIFIVLVSIEAGFRSGTHSHRSEDEKEAPVSGVSGAILGLAAFMLAFSFGIVAERYDARKALVREDANAIRTTWLRSDFLPEPDRTETRKLIRTYLDLRLAFTQGDFNKQRVQEVLVQSDHIQRRLWEIAVANGKADLNSDVAALYVESLNEMFDIHALRKAIGLQARVPVGVWLVLFGLIILGMASVGYHTGIAGSKRSKATLILALSFAMVTTLIAMLDRPGGHVRVTQQPLVDVQKAIGADDQSSSSSR